MPIGMNFTLLTILHKYNVISMINAFVKPFLSWIMVEGILLGITAKDIQLNAGAFGAVILAFLLRVAMDSKKSKPTFWGIVSQLIITSSLCYISVFVWRDYLDYKKGFEVYLFVISLFAVFIAGQLDSIFEMGFKSWARSIIGRIMAKNDGEDIK